MSKEVGGLVAGTGVMIFIYYTLWVIVTVLAI